ncbi:N-acetylmuramoyl-L-alanine amidase [Brevibacterium sp. ZH18]|uniref:peptidoglycan recognition protein family protein n=1 Tax=Brevibacterium sp. ZH18 TaxID=2927784 RepID=UPI001F61882A|nr:N-acetylmuramoyl-L-alanine amidase [Brevibacterium sp. ZH18]MCI4013027.1 N-acetylmuramoyl-L-alanine amidase [Brevibacterium sp. ZH18]
MKSYQGVCLHTMVGSLAGTDAMFQKDGTTGTESHFGVGENGEIYQWVDTAYTADANYLGSGHVISIETADYGGSFGRWNTNGDNVPYWNAKQIVSIVKILQWVHETHGIPLVATKSVTEKGVGYHAQGVPNNGLPASLRGTKYQWSKYPGKVCPGKKRISQIPEIVRLAKGGSTAVPAATEPATPKGVLGMTKRINAYLTGKQKATGTRHLMIDDKGNYTIVAGPAEFVVSAKADIGGLKKGEHGFLILAEVMYKKGHPTVISREIATVKVTANTVWSVAGAWTLPKDHKGKSPRLRLIFKTSSKTATAHNVYISGVRD